MCESVKSLFSVFEASDCGTHRGSGFQGIASLFGTGTHGPYARFESLPCTESPSTTGPSARLFLARGFFPWRVRLFLLRGFLGHLNAVDVFVVVYFVVLHTNFFFGK
jgi:hypothetical protein